MLTESNASHLARVRLAAESDDLRQNFLRESKLRVLESQARKRAEQEAEDMSLVLMTAEQHAKSAASSAQQLETALIQTSQELDAVRDEFSSTEASLHAEIASLRQELADAREHLARAERTSEDALSTHERELADAFEATGYVEAELLALRAAAVHGEKAMTHNAKREARALRGALVPWWHMTAHRFAERTVRKAVWRRVAARGFEMLRQPLIRDGLRDVAAKAAIALRSRSRRLAVTTWRDFAHDRKSALRAVSRGVGAFRLMGVRKGLTTWRELWRARREEQRRKANAFAEWRGGGMRKGWFSWHEVYTRYRTMAGALRSMRARRVRAGLNSWRATTAELATSKTKILGVLKSLDPRTGPLKVILRGLREQARQGRVMRKGLSGFIHSFQRKALNSWLDFGSTRRHQFRALRRGGAALRNVGMKKGFVSWQALAETAREKLRTLRHAVDSFRGASLRKGWNSVMDAFVQTAKKEGALRSMRQRNVRAGLNSWRALTTALSASKSKIGGVLKTIDPRTRGMRHALNKMIHDARLYRTMVNAGGGFRTTVKRRGWNTWVEAGQEQGAQMQALRRGGAGFRSRTLLRGYASWRELAVEEAEKQRRLRVAAGEFRGKGLRSGWMLIMDAFAHRAKLSAAFLSMRLRKVRMGYNLWAEVATSAGERRRRQAGALHSMSPDGRRKRAALNSMREFWVERRRLRRAALAIVRSREVQALNTWSALALAMTRNLRLIQMGRAAFRNRLLRAGATTWILATTEALEFQRRMRIAVGEWRGCGLRKGWMTMRELLELQKIGKRAVSAIKHRQVRVGHNTWRAYASAAKDWRRRVGGAIGIFSPEGRAVRKGFCSWRDLQLERLQLRRSANALFNHQTRMAWMCWITHARWTATTEATLPAVFKRAVALLVHKARALAFRQWREMASTKRTAQRRLQSAAREWCNGGVRKAWFSWREVVDVMLHLRSKLVALRNPGMRRAWSCWSARALDAARRKRKAEGTAKGLLTRGGYRAAWVAIVKAGSAQRTARGALAALISSRERAALKTWCDATTSKRSAALRMLMIRRHAEKHHMLSAWAKWRLIKAREACHVVTTSLYLRPAFDTWLSAWYLRRMAAPLALLGVCQAFSKWASVWGRRKATAGLRHIAGRERIRACYHGQAVLKRLRHSGLRGILGIWRASLLHGMPSVATAWVKWKARTTLLAVADAFRRKTATREKRRALRCFEADVMLSKLEQRLEALIAGRRAKLKVWNVELMAAEAHTNLLRKALDNAHNVSRRDMSALEAELSELRSSEAAARARADSEHAAALRALARGTPKRKPKPPPEPVKPPKIFDRWSTAAARGQAHGKVSTEKLEQIFQSQRVTVEAAAMAAPAAASTPQEVASRVLRKGFGTALAVTHMRKASSDPLGGLPFETLRVMAPASPASLKPSRSEGTLARASGMAALGMAALGVAAEESRRQAPSSPWHSSSSSSPPTAMRAPATPLAELLPLD